MAGKVHYSSAGYAWLLNAIRQVMLLTNGLGPWAVGDLSRDPRVMLNAKTGVLGPMPPPSEALDRALRDGTAILTNPPRKNRRGVLCYTETFDKSVSVVFADEKPAAMRAQVKDWVEGKVLPLVEAKLKELTVGTKREPSRGGYAEVHVHIVNAVGGPHLHLDIYFYNVAKKQDQTVGCVRNFTDKLFHGAGSFSAEIQKATADFLQAQGLKVHREKDNVVVDAVPRALCEALSTAKELAKELVRDAGLAPDAKGEQYANLLVRRAAEITHYQVPATLPALCAEFKQEFADAALKARVDLPRVRADIERQRNSPGRKPDWAAESYAAYTLTREALKGLPGPATAEQLKTFIFLQSIDMAGVTHKGAAAVAALAVKRPDSFDLRERPVQSRESAKEVVVRYMPGPPAAPPRPPEPPPPGPPAVKGDPAGPPIRPEPVKTRDAMKAERTWEEFAKAAFATAAELFKSGREGARAAIKAVLERFEPAPHKTTISTGRELERFLDRHDRGSRGRAHLAGFLAFGRASGNPHERAAPAERAYDRVRSRDRLRKGSTLIVENLHGELTDRERKALKRITDRDKAVLKVLEPIDMHRRHRERVREFLKHDDAVRRERRPPPPPPPPPEKGR